MHNDILKPFLNKRVTVTNTVGGGVYTGTLAGFRPNQFAINQLLIHTREGGVIASKTDRARWFTTLNCLVTLAEESPCHSTCSTTTTTQ